jgi:excisionase family DNA binding protein
MAHAHQWVQTYLIMSSNIYLQKICQECSQEFTARTTVTKYCGDLCAKRAYKKRKRSEKIAESNQETELQKIQPLLVLKEKTYLSINETVVLLGLSRRTLYRLIEKGQLQADKVGGRTLIQRKNIERIFTQEL